MTEDRQKIQQLQDMLQGSINQRNASQNECLQLAAQVAQLSRDLEAANRRIAELEPKDSDEKTTEKSSKRRVNGETHAQA